MATPQPALHALDRAKRPTKHMSLFRHLRSTASMGFDQVFLDSKYRSALKVDLEIVAGGFYAGLRNVWDVGAQRNMSPGRSLSVSRYVLDFLSLLGLPIIAVSLLSEESMREKDGEIRATGDSQSSLNATHEITELSKPSRIFLSCLRKSTRQRFMDARTRQPLLPKSLCCCRFL